MDDMVHVDDVLIKQEMTTLADDGGGDSDVEFAPDGSLQRGRRRLHFTVEQLKLYYHLPLKAAAHALGVCEAALKRICRRNRIKKWPYRRLQSVMRRMEDVARATESTRHSFLSVDDSGSEMIDFLLPHEIEGRHKMTADNDLSLLEWDDDDSLSTKLQQLEEERRAIIETAHITFPKEEMYASFPLPDSFNASTPLDLLATLCVSSCKKVTPRATPCAQDGADRGVDGARDMKLWWMTETA